MPSATYYIGVSPNEGQWELGNITGQQFEDLVAKSVAWHLRHTPASVRVTQTRRVHDGGKDIVVHATIPITLFGFRLARNDKPSFKVYIEVKHTTGDRLSGDFRQNFTQFEDDVPDYYILVTDSTITPYNQWTAALDCKGRTCRFLLADKYLAYSFLQESLGSVAGQWKGEAPPPIVIEYQSDRAPTHNNIEIRLFLSIRNYKKEQATCSIRLVTNENWKLSEAAEWASDERAIFIIEPMETFTTRITAKKDANVGLPDLRITLNVNEEPKEVRVYNRNLDFDFVPPLTGHIHRQLVKRMEDLLAESAGGENLIFISITGYAGRGKSRIIEELREGGRTGFTMDEVVFFGRGSEKEAINKLLERAGHHSSKESAAERLEDFFVNFNAFFENKLIVFEDLHHASREVIDSLKACMTSSTTPGNGSLALIFTGRNDFTFPNEDYFSLLELFAIRSDDAKIHSFVVPELTDDETKHLIRATIQNIPDVALEKIFSLAENTPFYVVQVIEYLLEMKLAKLVNRNTVGIPEVQKFNIKDALPAEILKIYEARFDALRHAAHGNVIREFLIAASFFGFVVPRLVAEILFDGLDNEAIYKTILGRHFLRFRSTGEMTFSHENLLNFLRDYARRPENRLSASAKLLEYPTLHSLLPQHARGELLLLGDKIENCMEHFRDIIEAIERINNFSSEDLDTRYFPYLDCLFEAALRIKSSPALLQKIILAESYMAVHNFAVSRGVEICRRATEKIKRTSLQGDARLTLRASLRQLEAHGLLNVGRTHSSWKIMLELEAETRLMPHIVSAKPELLFDLYDRLQELFKKWNHYALAHTYGQLAEQVAHENRNIKLMACNAITSAGMDLYTDPEKAHRTAERAHSLANDKEAHGASRLGVYTGLSLCLIEALQNRNDRKQLDLIRRRVREIVEVAAKENLPDSLMRSQLLLATLTYYLGPDDRRSRELAKQYADAGLNASLKYGNGLFLWLLYNLRAIITIAERGRGDEIDAYFNSARESMRLQSLLFLGNIDVCYPNIFVISNCVLRRLTVSETAAYEIIRRLESYQSYDGTSPIAEGGILKQLANSKVIFKNRNKYAVFVDPLTGYLLPVL